MLVYSKAHWSLPLLFRGFLSAGSPVTRSLLIPALSVLQTLFIFQFTCAGVPSLDDVLSGLAVHPALGPRGGGAAAADAASAAPSNGACKGGIYFVSAYPYQIFASLLGFLLVRRGARGAHVATMHVRSFWGLV